MLLMYMYTLFAVSCLLFVQIFCSQIFHVDLAAFLQADPLASCSFHVILFVLTCMLLDFTYTKSFCHVHGDIYTTCLY